MEFNTARCILSNDLPWSWISIPKCPKCKNSQLKRNANIRNVRLNLLPCSHNLCGGCVTSLSKTQDPKCYQCSARITFNRLMDPNCQFEYNFYIYGLSHYKEYVLRDILKNKIGDFLQADSTRQIMSASPETKCIECLSSTQSMCVQCGHPYCNSCFVKVHAVGVVIRSHELVPLNSVSKIGRVLNPCKHHNNKIEHFCQTCKIPICRLCISKAHCKHEIRKLVANNQKVDLSETLDLLKSAQEKINGATQITVNYINKIGDYATSTAQEISEYFQYYHAVLQNIEKDALIELKKRTVDNIQKIHEVQSTLRLSSDKIETTNSRVIKFSMNTPNDVNLATLHDEVISLLEDVPTDLKMKHFDEKLFSFDVDHFDQSVIRQRFQVTFKDNYFSPKLDTFFGQPCSADNSLLSDKALLRRDSKISKQAASKASPQQSLESAKSPKIETREVYVIEIKDSKTFNVQNVEFLEKAEQFIQECNQCATNSVIVTDVAIDDMVLLYESDQTKWYRGIVKEHFAKSEVAVFLVDYARTLRVNVKQIREISSDLKSLPAAAYVFTIFNIEPKNGKWSDESKALIHEITFKERMTSIYKNGNENSGDLITHSVHPASVKDMLLYLQYGAIANVNDSDISQLHRRIEEKKKSIYAASLEKAEDFKKQLIKLDENFHAKVVNIISPKEFYITKISHADEIDILSKKVNVFYDDGHYRKIYYPHIGMACCVNTSGQWSRARIHKHHPNLMVEVFLVDIGAYCCVEWGQIKILEHQFMDLPEGVSKCGLADIEPKNYETEWNPAATVEMKRLCKNDLKVFVCELNSRSIEILLFVALKNISYLVNAWLAKVGLAEWVGENELTVEHPNIDFLDTTCSPALITTNTKHRELRQFVKIASIMSPSEFYVTLVNFQHGLEIMHSKLQEILPTERNNEVWGIGDHCLVKVLSNNIWEWNRGQILTIEDDSTTVFLRDYGKIASATLLNLAEIEPYYDNVTDGAIKCHLADVKPTSSNWAKSAIDEFKHMATSDEGYDDLAVSVYGKQVDGSFPVYLWGQKKSYNCAVSGPSISWQNINEELTSRGFADCIEKFKTIVDCESLDNQIEHNEMIDFVAWSAKFIDDIDAHNVEKKRPADDDFLLEAELDPESDDYCKAKVTAWLPATPIGKYQFTGIPTYVDNNAVIYLHATSQVEYLQKLKCTINKQIEKVPCDMLYKWKIGDTCMVRYDLDNCFYRGVIKDVLPNRQFKIEFVDYGNVEECDQSYIREANILGIVPIQATKYYLSNLKPKSENGLWDKKILEFIHSNIVNQMVNVRVAEKINEKYIPCSITVGAMTMNKILLAENLADYTNDINIILPHADTYDYYKDSSDTIGRDQDKYKLSVSLEKFKEKIAEKKEAEKQKKYIAQFNFDDLNADFIVEDDLNEIFNEKQSFTDDEFEFHPIDQSTEKSVPITKVSNKPSFTLDFHPFVEFMPSKDIKKLSAKIVQILDPLHIILEPIIDDLIANLEKMENKMKKLSHKSSEKFNFKENRACLARYSIDNCYYRAVIGNPSYSNDSAQVTFVDYLESKIVERKYIRECPDEAVKLPLKYFVVKLHGVTPNRRMREKDIMNLLEELVDKKVIVKMATYHHTSPKSVHIYDTENQSVLIYQSLIDANFYKLD